MTTISPRGHKILIAPLEWDKETDWGFQMIEGSTQEKLEKAGRMIGTVAAVGPQAWAAHAVSLVKDSALFKDNVLDDWAEVGETVLYSRYAGKEVYDPVTGEEFYLINDEDVLAGLPPKEDWKYKPTEKGERV